MSWIAAMTWGWAGAAGLLCLLVAAVTRAGERSSRKAASPGVDLLEALGLEDVHGSELDVGPVVRYERRRGADRRTGGRPWGDTAPGRRVDDWLAVEEAKADRERREAEARQARFLLRREAGG